MAYSKSQRKATEKWEAQNYEQIRFTVPKGFKERLQESVKRTGAKSQRAFIISTLEEKIKEDKTMIKRWAIYNNKRQRVGHVDTNRVFDINEGIKLIADESKPHEYAYFDEAYEDEKIVRIGDTWYSPAELGKFTAKIVKE